MRGSAFVLMSLTLAGSTEMLRGQPASPNAIPDVRIDQNLGAQVPLELTLTDSKGQAVSLEELLDDKPAVLSLVYYRCPMLCTQVLNGELRALRALSPTAGEDFNVITVSIDPKETPALAAEKKADYLEKYNRPSAERGWYFLTGDENSIERLADSVGFRYTYDPETELFAHASGIMVLAPDGTISQYFYGIEYAPRDLQLALVEASDGKVGSVVDQMLLLCFHYDPTTGKYGLAIMSIIRCLALLTVLGMGTAVFMMIRRDRRLGAGATGGGTDSTGRSSEF